MKKFILLFLLIFLTGCSPLVADTVPTTNIPEIVTVTSIVTETIQVENTEKIEQLETELAKYQSLIANLNDLLKCVYYGYGENANYFGEFTAFSMEYNDKFYIITAGHCVEMNGIKYNKFKFKPNFSDNWIYPKLLTYENNFSNNKDYAIFFSDKITSGLDFSIKGSSPQFILGNLKLNIFKNYDFYNSISGESGSPVININGKVIGIATGKYTDIDIVLQAIDNLK